ncbi:MAG: hypothetical protein ACSLE1_05265 [Sphingobium sp.]
MSLRNQIVVTVTSTCVKCMPTGPDSIRLSPVRVVLGKASSNVQNFHQLVPLLRAGVRINADPANADLARRVLAELAPIARIDGAAANEIIVSAFPPPGTDPWLRFDRGPVQLVTRNGLQLYTEEQLSRLTIVQIVKRGGYYSLWVRPGRGASVPTLMPLDYGDVAIFQANGPEIAFSTSEDRIVQAAYGRQEAEEDAFFRIWRSSVLAIWAALTIGAALLMRRLPRLQPRKI